MSLHVAVFALLTPSVQQGHHGDESGSYGVAPVWGLRLLQLQIALGYLTTFTEKVRGSDWIDGSAVFHAMASDTLQRFDPPSWIIDNEPLIKGLTWGTVAVEGLLPVLLLWPKTRRYGVLLVLGLHVGFEVFLQLGFFAPAMAIGALAFVSPADARRVLDLLSGPRRMLRQAKHRASTSVSGARRAPSVPTP